METKPSPKESSATLSPRKAIAALDLAHGHSAADTAARAEVSEQTMSAWRNDPAFIAAIDAERKRAEERARAAYDELEDKKMLIRQKAFDVVDRQLDSKDASIALAAARIALKGS